MKITLGSVKTGQVFKYEGGIYIRALNGGSLDDDKNAYCLSNNCVVRIDFAKEVELMNMDSYDLLKYIKY